MSVRCLALMTEAFGCRGGIQEFNRHWLRALAAQSGVEVQALVTRGEAHAEPGLKQQVASPGRLGYALAARRAVRRFAPQVLISGHLSLLPLVAQLRGRSALWQQLHGIEAWNPPAAKWRRYGMHDLQLVSAVSRYTRRRFLDWSALPEHRVRVLPNTLREDCSPASDRDAERLDLLSVGRLNSAERYKGHDRVLEALAEIARSSPQVCYRIAGEGNDADRLRRLAAELGVAKHVEFLGAVRRPQLLELYRSARLFVMPSTGEGFGIVFLEALACGCPVLGLAEDGSVDPLSVHSGAHVIDSSTNLAAKIIELLKTEAPYPDPKEVWRRFGPQPFRSQVATLLDQVLTA
ncbi:MAG: glycosyltransferase family 4 protein [Pseudomonadota bacterium]